MKHLSIQRLIQIFIADLYVISQTEHNPNAHQQENKQNVVYKHILWYYLAIKRKELLKHKTRENLKIIVQTERIQIPDYMCCMVSFTLNSIDYKVPYSDSSCLKTSMDSKGTWEGFWRWQKYSVSWFFWLFHGWKHKLKFIELYTLIMYCLVYIYNTTAILKLHN